MQPQGNHREHRVIHIYVKPHKVFQSVRGISRSSLWLVCRCVLAFLILLSGCRGKAVPTALSRQTVGGVTVTEVHPSEIEEYLETSGAIRAKTISRIAGQTM